MSLFLIHFWKIFSPCFVFRVDSSFISTIEKRCGISFRPSRFLMRKFITVFGIVFPFYIRCCFFLAGFQKTKKPGLRKGLSRINRDLQLGVILPTVFDNVCRHPLQCSCLENPRDGGAWWAAVSGVAQSRTRLKRLSSSSSRPCWSSQLREGVLLGIVVFQSLSRVWLFPTPSTDCGTSGSFALQYLSEFAHVHWVRDAI